MMMWRQSTAWVALLAGLYLGVLPMSGTIALRSVVSVVLLIFVVKGLARNWRDLHLGVPVLLWAIYLVLFPVFAADHAVAWQSFFGQWMRGLLAMLMGAGVAVFLAEEDRKEDALFIFGLASTAPLLIHLGYLAIAAWNTSSIPWGNWGREMHHADLGYAAGQAILLLSVVVAAGSPKFRWWSIALVMLSLLSVLLARSRAGLLFGLLACVLPLGVTYMKVDQRQRRRTVWVLAGAVVLAGFALAMAVKIDPRWQRTIAQMASAWSGDAVQIICRGEGAPEPTPVPDSGTDDAPQVTSRAFAGDGSRMVLLRVGFELALEHPWGLDGSRQAYQKRLQQVCPNPAFFMAHTHIGWLDTVLALGWIGAALYLWVLLHFLRVGYTYLRTGQTVNPWALVLIAASLFWILRGLTDSVFRDHMLEMQGFLLAYAAVTLRYKGERSTWGAGLP
ncbi:MAG: O-antigen ligase family protein [Hylemonella sp.]|nr:O-antigen ligase family protein [Hylemonella sp.]